MCTASFLFLVFSDEIEQRVDMQQRMLPGFAAIAVWNQRPVLRLTPPSREPFYLLL
jgi:hypothetical protein